jgi:hypothetical protein
LCRQNLWEFTYAVDQLLKANPTVRQFNVLDLKPYCQPRLDRRNLRMGKVWLTWARPEGFPALVIVGLMIWLAGRSSRSLAGGTAVMICGLMLWFSDPIAALAWKPGWSYLEDFECAEIPEPDRPPSILVYERTPGPSGTRMVGRLGRRTFDRLDERAFKRLLDLKPVILSRRP